MFAALSIAFVAASPLPRAEAAMLERGTKLEALALRLEVESRVFAAGESEFPDGPPALAALRTDRLELRLDGSEAERKVKIAATAGGTTDFTERLEGCEGSRSALNKNGVQRVEPLAAAEVRAFQRAIAMLPLWLVTQKLQTKPAKPVKHDSRTLPAIDVKTPDGVITVAFDPATGLPALVRRTLSHPLFGPKTYEAQYTAWRSAGPLRIPKAWTLSFGGEAIEYATVTEASTVKAKPNTLKACAEPPKAEESDVVRLTLDRSGVGESRDWQLVPVGKGVQRLSGPAGDVLVVEMRDHLIVFDAPCAGRCAALAMGELEAAFPKKPIRTLVLSHHHETRTAGLLAWAPRVQQVIVSGSARSWAEKLIGRLPKRERPTVLDVAPTRALTDGSRQVKLTRLVDHPHASTLLMAFVPDAKVLWAVDVAVGRDDPLHYEWNDRLARAEKSIGVGAGALVVDGHGSVAPHTSLASAAVR